ncbi:MAG TPA: DUF4266 domain-containing protein [Puia sp.]|nr:DUF4266 domain-containing protein [Puia sp.]
MGTKSSGRGLSFFLCGLAVFIFPCCSPVKEYQKNRINDAEMSLSNRKAERNELNFQSYREGAAGVNGGKTGGGCGCN